MLPSNNGKRPHGLAFGSDQGSQTDGRVLSRQAMGKKILLQQANNSRPAGNSSNRASAVPPFRAAVQQQQAVGRTIGVGGAAAGAVGTNNQQQAAAQHAAQQAKSAARDQSCPLPSLFSWALVCACNMNRSTSGHVELLQWGYQRVTSFGTSDAVRLPGRHGTNHAFTFGTRYADILSRMINNDNSMRDWMATYGLSNMLLRNAGLKAAPESWRDRRDDEVRSVDFALCYDRSVYLAVLAGECKLQAVTWHAGLVGFHLCASSLSASFFFFLSRAFLCRSRPPTSDDRN